MRKYILIYGGLFGLITISSMLFGILSSDGEGLGSSMAVGFLIMFVASTLIYFGVRKYRDQEQGGIITFGGAFKVGLGMAVMGAIMYILVWEIYLRQTDYQFVHDYTASMIADKESGGLSGKELAAYKDDMAKMVVDYGKAPYRVAITFTEIFPVGLLVSLVTAFFVRYPKNKKQHRSDTCNLEIFRPA